MDDDVSTVSNLSELENGETDDFERLMIQNARDERRLKDARQGRVQAFRKARTHPRVGLTIDNLERNNARNSGALDPSAHVKFQSPPSSSGSARSDPAIHAPAGWGRKSRSNRNWMRTIAYDEQAQTPVPADDTIHGDQYQRHAGMDDEADLPRDFGQDSPLSHKGTPRNDRSAEWDLTFELNEASIIASTPYIPRSTVLDDIRERELEGVKRESMSRSLSEETLQPQTVASENEPSPEAKRKRTNSWKSIGKSQPVTGAGMDNSPIVYTSVETVTVDRVSQGSSRPLQHRRHDSQDLLRRLARASNTPSPARIAAPPQQTAPDALPAQMDKALEPSHQTPVPTTSIEPPAAEGRGETSQDEPAAKQQETIAASNIAPKPAPVEIAEDVDATPMPVDQPRLEAKTPVVTGAWVDTPGPRTVRKHISIARSPSQSPKKRSPQKQRSPQRTSAPAVEELQEDTAAEVVRPQLPSSALQALVQEAKAPGRRPSADYGDSTINSLEDLITSPAEGEVDEDTLQGLQLPTETPRNEAERQRQQELLHLHRMNDRLRAARTSIRDVSRGMKRVEGRVEHDEEDGSTKARVVIHECPCAADGHGHSTLLQQTRNLFWNSHLKTQRKGTRWRYWGGLTTLSIVLTTLLLWWISEEIACEMFCHHPYAQYSPYPYSVNPNAPQYPFVIPSLIYRSVVGWWLPPEFAATWTQDTTWQDSSTRVAQQVAAQRTVEVEWDQSMAYDEVVR
ncbi:hypothetical protein BKA63DRAFT_270053 [Paraphoma chrysanthemicola]|nr:hypothetical protein BKA63DRAFT_270053 [Paraphoma chrysanthemicola]